MSKGLYIHIPFCLQKCKYCDFISFTVGNKEAYIDALKKELSMYVNTEIDSVFIGGGTPTVLSYSLMEKLLKYINNTFKLAKDTEWSIEANPKTVNEEKLSLMREMGVNRISIGVQSFNDVELQRIGRIHTAEDAIDTIKLAKKYFENINIDLISALPGQNINSFRNTLNTAIALEPAHISCYSLILEEGTPLYNEHIASPLNIPDEDAERDMYEMAVGMLGDAGYKRYEISNFAKAGRESRHNLKYWQCEDYIGAGLAAHSLIDGIRYENTDDIESYLSGNALKEKIVLTLSDMISEYIIMAFRLEKGISSKQFKAKFDIDFEKEYKMQLERFISLGLIEKTIEGYHLTNEGISLSNSVLCEFV